MMSCHTLINDSVTQNLHFITLHIIAHQITTLHHHNYTIISLYITWVDLCHVVPLRSITCVSPICIQACLYCLFEHNGLLDGRPLNVPCEIEGLWSHRCCHCYCEEDSTCLMDSDRHRDQSIHPPSPSQRSCCVEVMYENDRMNACIHASTTVHTHAHALARTHTHTKHTR